MSFRKFILSCESTVDLPYAYVAGRDIPVLFYSYMIDGVTYTDDMGRDPDSVPAFYRRLKEGALPTTAQLNEVQYEEFLGELLEKGEASVSEIAYATVFSGASYFIESFRRELGTTPLKYRRERAGAAGFSG